MCLESGSLNYLIVGKHIDFPLKRSLLQFEDLPLTCSYSEIKWAKMYVYFADSFIAPSYTVAEAPYISRPLQVYQVSYFVQVYLSEI